jgi:hypothetical protein
MRRWNLPSLSTRYIREKIKPGDLLARRIFSNGIYVTNNELVLVCCLNRSSKFGHDYIDVWCFKHGYRSVHRSHLSRRWQLVDGDEKK